MMTSIFLNKFKSIYNPKCAHYLDAIYPSQLEIKDMNDSSSCASYLDLNINYETNKSLHLNLYDKPGDILFCQLSISMQ